MTFDEQLKYGKIGESRIAGYFKALGYSVLPVYEKENQEWKGPALYAFDSSEIVAPDMMVFSKSGRCFWVEAKRKSAFTWHRNTSRWVTGIDLHHYESYLRIARDLSPWPVWLLFLHEPNGEAKDTPPGMKSPSGLFGNDILALAACENHRSTNHGRHGMVYWAYGSLKRLRIDQKEIAA